MTQSLSHLCSCSCLCWALSLSLNFIYKVSDSLLLSQESGWDWVLVLVWFQQIHVWATHTLSFWLCFLCPIPIPNFLVALRFNSPFCFLLFRLSATWTLPIHLIALTPEKHRHLFVSTFFYWYVNAFWFLSDFSN